MAAQPIPFPLSRASAPRPLGRTSRRLGALRRHPLFRELSPEAWRRISGRCLVRPVRAEEVLVRQGEADPPLVVVLDGELEIYRSRGDLWIQTLRRSSSEGMALLCSVLGEEPAAASVRATGDGLVAAIEGDALRHEARQDPGFAMLLAKRVACYAIGLGSLAADLSLYTLEERLVHFLLDEAPGPDDPEGSWRYTHEDLARHLGGCREEVTRTLSKLRRRGLIETGRRRIRIVDVDGLRRMLPRDVT